MQLKEARKRLWNEALRHLWRIAVAIVGTLVLLVGIVMLVTPGPAFVVIPLGLGILATQFRWAKHALRQMKQRATQIVRATGRTSGDSAEPSRSNSGQPLKSETTAPVESRSP
jgi:uncharacterized protein (TIGR02611 family)